VTRAENNEVDMKGSNREKDVMKEQKQLYSLRAVLWTEIALAIAAALLAPQFTADPALDSTGRLRLTGLLPTRPLQISFDLSFQSIAGQWRLFAVSVATPEAPTAQSQLNREAPRHSSSAFVYALRAFSGNAGWRW
jgi:hypothetical protein